jgi:tryptophan synthase alpha chain
MIAAASEGFVYLVARLGVTGRGGSAADTGAPGHRGTALAERIAAVRAATPLPVAVGFGISEPDQAAHVATMADGVVIGSALVERMQAGGAAAALAWLREVRTAVDSARRAA